MKYVKRALQLLRESGYLEAIYLGENKIADIALLKNGRTFRKHLLHEWKNIQPYATQFYTEKILNLSEKPKSGRLSFLNCENFNKYLQELLEKNLLVAGSAHVKSLFNCTATTQNTFHFKNPHTIQLVSDYFVHALRGQDTFYSVQRERKIWWMRYSADPSHYFVEPFNISQERDYNVEYSSSKIFQSVTIKSSIFNNHMDIETITLVPLIGEPYLHLNLVRSVIDLNLTTFALLMDAGGHDGFPHVLKLNRKLAPYQCLLTILCEGTRNDAVHDLCFHVNHVVSRAGLRLYNTSLCANSKEELIPVLRKADKLGIPYTIILEENSLITGILKLRSRETSLVETVHISDLPTYLSKICA